MITKDPLDDVPGPMKSDYLAFFFTKLRRVMNANGTWGDLLAEMGLPSQNVKLKTSGMIPIFEELRPDRNRAIWACVRYVRALQSHDDRELASEAQALIAALNACYPPDEDFYAKDDSD